MAKKVFVIDIARCNGCHNCQIVCKDEHVANDWTPIAKPQPDTGQFWNKVNHVLPKLLGRASWSVRELHVSTS